MPSDIPSLVPLTPGQTPTHIGDPHHKQFCSKIVHPTSRETTLLWFRSPNNNGKAHKKVGTESAHLIMQFLLGSAILFRYAYTQLFELRWLFDFFIQTVTHQLTDKMHDWFEFTQRSGNLLFGLVWLDWFISILFFRDFSAHPPQSPAQASF